MLQSAARARRVVDCGASWRCCAEGRDRASMRKFFAGMSLDRRLVPAGAVADPGIVEAPDELLLALVDRGQRLAVGS